MRSEMVSTLKRQPTRILSDLHNSPEPILITEKGKPSAYLINIADYEAMVQRMSLLEAIAKGEQDLVNDRTHSHTQVQTRLNKWLK